MSYNYSVEDAFTNLNNKIILLEKSVKHNFDITGNELVQLSANVEQYKNKQIITENIIEQHIILNDELQNNKTITISNKKKIKNLDDKIKDMEKQMELYTMTIRKINIILDEELDYIEKKIKINSHNYNNVIIIVTGFIISTIICNYFQYNKYMFMNYL